MPGSLSLPKKFLQPLPDIQQGALPLLPVDVLFCRWAECNIFNILLPTAHRPSPVLSFLLHTGVRPASQLPSGFCVELVAPGYVERFQPPESRPKTGRGARARVPGAEPVASMDTAGRTQSATRVSGSSLGGSGKGGTPSPATGASPAGVTPSSHPRTKRGRVASPLGPLASLRAPSSDEEEEEQPPRRPSSGRKARKVIADLRADTSDEESSHEEADEATAPDTRQDTKRPRAAEARKSPMDNDRSRYGWGVQRIGGERL